MSRCFQMRTISVLPRIRDVRGERRHPIAGREHLKVPLQHGVHFRLQVGARRSEEGSCGTLPSRAGRKQQCFRAIVWPTRRSASASGTARAGLRLGRGPLAFLLSFLLTPKSGPSDTHRHPGAVASHLKSASGADFERRAGPVPVLRRGTARGLEAQILSAHPPTDPHSV